MMIYEDTHQDQLNLKLLLLLLLSSFICLFISVFMGHFANQLASNKLEFLGFLKMTPSWLTWWTQPQLSFDSSLTSKRYCEK